MQQVNLYLPELRPQREWLTAKNAVVTTLLFIAVIIAIQVIWGLRENRLQEAVVQQQAVLEDLQTRVDQLKALAPPVAHRSYDETISQLENAIANRQKVGRIIRGQNVGNARGFHITLQALARESSPDVALDRFTFSRGGGYVEMQGKTRSAQAVPLYLQRLKNNAAFQDARFGLLSVSSERDAGRALDFSLGYDNLYLQQNGENRQR